ncbi:SPOR domain-containing protein [Fuchsiella alkaliacetigena]|uniref:SPOR domain-containing protein n=1 Tax=Fuchsiella alkaliacetigena TaxID=957042 RepID=UPI00200A7EAD|nr:SPOR domain-containing protein [Fuchsiella alkaliacetigena]MCK8824430.1 SPOR domain-containing protein [Fuchsiella alkaliacetigena]
MNFDRSRLKSGFSLAAMIISMSILASVVGYFLGSWMIQYVTAPEEEMDEVPSEEVVLEEEISQNGEEESDLEEAVDLDAAEEGEELEDLEPQETMGEGLYEVQVGAFSSEDNAQGMVRQLEDLGYSAYITSEDPYRVQVGAFEDKESAQNLGQQLEEDGFNFFISN